MQDRIAQIDENLSAPHGASDRHALEHGDCVGENCHDGRHNRNHRHDGHTKAFNKSGAEDRYGSKD